MESNGVKKRKRLDECRWHARMNSCYDDEQEKTVWYWCVWQIEGGCGLATDDSIELVPKVNFGSKEEAAEDFREFLKTNGIAQYKLDWR